eukprot:CAMPEP_0170551306 /NCGR_PEP_ID=MMETSP0211-20121228/9332_1 /TAXON_ID=311385 /ORGANISM="Pseudokeronopsis sp., Strain OXSARD2" /LENGTH=75 /DNA_ID=CAMNT_0010858403 /DNA_START=358 /DNA_END=585 /DNA_ORIENTATION=-
MKLEAASQDAELESGESLVKEREKQEELNERIEESIMTNLPPQEGGIDYKKQHSLIEMANLAILDEIKRLDKNVK